MKITSIETLRSDRQPNVLFVRLHSDQGLVGLGEAFYDAEAVEVYLHQSLAPALFALPDAAPQRAATALSSYVGYQGSGVETRARGAVDIALWDLLGRQAGLPVARLLGGPVRDHIRVYNTCAGSGYVSRTSRQESDNWGLGTGPYDDLHAFLTRPGQLARELRDEGITGMKIWPFDEAAERSGGRDIGRDELARGIGVVEEIREAVGFDVEVMVELHGLWGRRGAAKICQALDPYAPAWVEDPIRLDATDALAALAAEVSVPIATGETCVGRRGFLPLLERGAVDVVTCDPHWTGGLTEAVKVAALADTFEVAFAPHDCTGPVSFAACCHLSLSQPNALVQETVRAFLRTWYGEFVSGLPLVSEGSVRLGDAPGLGVELREEAVARMEVRRTESAAPGAFRVRPARGSAPART